jgi:predicted RNase H-like nuclease
MVAGIDGCRAGWIAFLTETCSNSVSAPASRIIRSAEELRDVIAGCRHVFIDIPVGLNERGYRSCDLALREVLPAPKKASVFMTPVRQAVCAGDYRSACDINREGTGSAISIQAWNIVPRIREVDRLLSDHPGLAAKVLECHPEWQFLLAARQLAPEPGSGLRPGLRPEPRPGLTLVSKKTAEGIAGRLDLLGRLNPVYPKAFEEVLQNEKRRDVKPDDILDALMLMHAARRLANGAELSMFPEDRLRDSNGLPLNIHYIKAVAGQ